MSDYMQQAHLIPLFTYMKNDTVCVGVESHGNVIDPYWRGGLMDSWSGVSFGLSLKEYKVVFV